MSLNKKNSFKIVNIHDVGVKQYKRISTNVDEKANQQYAAQLSNIKEFLLM